MGLQELTRTVAVLRALGDLVEQQLRDVKADTLDELTAMGVERVKATLPDGTLVAHVTRVGAAPTIAVTHESLLLEWARTNAPEMIEHVPEQVTTVPAHDRLKSGEVAALLERHSIRDGLAVSDEGELTPGVNVKVKDPYIMVKFAPGGREMIAEGLRQQWMVDSVVRGLLEVGDES